MTEKRTPKYALDDFEFGEGPDAFFAAVIRRLNEGHARAEELADRKPEVPQEEKPVRRRSQLLEQRPLRGWRKPDPKPRDADT